MRITFILPAFPRKPIGGFRIVYEYANRLVARGHEVNLVHPKTLMDSVSSPNRFYRQLRGYLAYLYRFCKNSVIPIPNRPIWQHIDPRVQFLIVNRPIAKYVPSADIVFATTWAIAEYVLEYPKNKGEKAYLYQHYEIWSGPKDRVDATWEAPFKKIVISKWLYDIGLSLGATDMFYIPNGIDFNRFKIVNPIETRCQRVAMMFSKLKWKGTEDGLKVLSLAKERNPSLQAILFGAEKRPSNIPEWVEYKRSPSQKELVEEIYNGSSIFLCPSHTEGFALPPAEAMACGCAIVTTDCGGVRDFVEHGINSLVLPPKDVTKLAENLCLLLSNDALRIKYAKAGHDNIQQFTWERSINLMEQFLNINVASGY